MIKKKYAKNKELVEYYNAVYKKGERKHYTKFFHSAGVLTEEKKAIISEIKWKNQSVLDIGCGTGELAYHIAKKTKGQVVGVDFSPEAIKIAAATYHIPNLHFVRGDYRRIKETFHCVILAGVLEHFDRPYQFLKDAKKMVKRGGSLIVTCPNWSNVRGNILMATRMIFGGRITLADLHYFTPIEFIDWSKRLHIKMKWRTFEQDWGHGQKMITDFKKRLPAVLRPMRKTKASKRASQFIEWLSRHISMETDQPHSGAVALYHFSL